MANAAEMCVAMIVVVVVVDVEESRNVHYEFPLPVKTSPILASFGGCSHGHRQLKVPTPSSTTTSTANVRRRHLRKMTTSRSESINQPSYGRKRSNTVQSFLRSPTTPATPLSIGDAQVLSLWVHDASTQGADVVFNPDHWPGVSEGDMVRVTAAPAEDQELRMREPDGFLFVVQRDDTRALNNMLQARSFRWND